MAYIGKEPGSGLRGRFIYTATAGQTSFTGADSLGRTLTYTDGEYTDVFLNGVKLDKTDYTATSGTSIVLDSGASADDTLEILAFDTFGLFSGEFAQDVSVGGDLTVDTNTLKVDSTNNRVGVGTASPVAPLHVKAATDVHVGIDDSSSDALIFAANDASATAVVPLKFQANSFKFNGSSEFVRITDAGKIGIGTTTPENPIEIQTANTLGSTFTGTTHGEGLRVTQSSYSDGNFVSLVEAPYQPNGVANVRVAALFESGGSSLAFGTSNSFGSGITNETMRMDFNGNLLIGVTATGNNGAFFSPASNNRTALFLGTSTTSTSTLQVFRNSNGTVGAISVSGSATAYATSSDYRLKENVTGITDGITRVKQLKPSRFNFKSDPDTKVDGFLAHEAETVVPEAVTGTKDETEAIGDLKDADGNVLESKVVKPENLADGRTWTETGTQPVYQGIDQAKLVPVLTAALQEAIAKIETLETKIAALEAG